MHQSFRGLSWQRYAYERIYPGFRHELTLLQVQGSLYLFGLIAPSKLNLLIQLQAKLASCVESLGHIPFNRYRAVRNQVRQELEPNRFVDGELIEQFLESSPQVQEKVVEGLGVGVEEVKAIVETLRRLH